MIIKRLLLPMFLGMSYCNPSLFCQESFDFEYQEIEVTVFPKSPGVCPNSTTDIICLETFESYKWEMVDPHPQFTTLYGQAQELIYPGEYRLTVEKFINDKLCMEQILFEVHNLQNSQGIEKYLTENGFYPVPIIINQVGLKNDKNETRTSCDLEGIKFSSEFEYLDLDTEEVITNIVNEFKPFNNEDYAAVQVKSENTCFCSVGIDELEDSFYNNPLAIWAHVFSESEGDTNGKLYLKGVIPFEGEVPKNDKHIEHLETIHIQVINDDQNNADAQKATFEHLRVIISNILMPNPTGGYLLDTQCSISENEINNNHLFTPGRQAILLPTGASEVLLENDLSSPSYGSVVNFNTENKSWQNYHRNEEMQISNGFFNSINAEFYEDFQTSISECNDCVLDIASIVQGCDNFSCSIESNQYSSEYFDINSVKDGGFNYDISSCNSTWSLWPITKRSSKELIYDLICAIKNGDDTFEFNDKFSGKVIFAKNIILSDLHYDYVGVIMPAEGNSIDLLDTPLLNNNGIPLGFINSFEISSDSDVRLNFLKLGFDGNSEDETEAVSKLCQGILKAAYTYTKWGETSNSIKNCLQYYNINDKYKLLDYLDPPEKDNLLILVNGYRILGFSPGKKWYNGGVEYPTKEPNDAINTCYDNFEDGDYWGEAGANFAKRINKNVIYVDGHHSIATSNHLQMATDDVSQISFLSSLLSCFPLKYTCLNFACTLNDIPNGSGFFIRYTNGLGAGVNIWNQMVAGDINVGLSDDKTQITGKIDIVAHSMGYAYSKGIIDYLTDKMSVGNTFGNYYIIAPENARAYTDEEFESYPSDLQQDVVVDLDLFESVFQYGSNFNPNGDPKCKQDGVAPQKRVRGLPDDNTNNVFIPASEEKIKNFVHAHLMENYGWLFDLGKNQDGYIKPRN